MVGGNDKPRLEEKMYKEKTILGLIPARGGSKGLPKKNIRPLLGKPLIAWTIEQAKASKYVDRVVVSTDDKEIAEVARQYGAEVPFMRPKELARDDTPGVDVVFHAMNWFIKNENKQYDLIMLLQPTSPLRAAEDIDKAIELLFFKKAKAIVSVCEVDHHPLWTNTLPEDGNMKAFLRPEILNKRRQDLPVFYRLNGAIYLARLDYLRKCNGFFGPETYAYVMPRERSIDVDTNFDLKLVEYFISLASK